MGQVMIRGPDGRLEGSKGLTAQQQAILTAYADTGTAIEAAQRVGCTAATARATLSLAHVQAALVGECRNLLARHAPVLIGVLMAIAKNTEAPYRDRIAAAKLALDRGGLVPLKPVEAGQGDKRDLSDLSSEELQAFITQGNEKLAQAKALTVEGTIKPA